jgi:hypothetical protein
MARPAISNSTYRLATTAGCVTQFDWPLGSALNAGQYAFTKVINFDPQGVARIQTNGNADGIVTYMEIGLQQTKGATIIADPNVAAIQIDCMTGATKKYRP